MRSRGDDGLGAFVQPIFGTIATTRRGKSGTLRAAAAPWRPPGQETPMIAVTFRNVPPSSRFPLPRKPSISSSMRTEEPRPVRLEDYRPPDWRIGTVELDVVLHPTATTVRAKLSVSPNGAGAQAPQRPFDLEIETVLDPTNNTKLMGLYRAGSTYCTQCEAEGFRRITYFLDRPDVMAIYTTRIEAEKK